MAAVQRHSPRSGSRWRSNRGHAADGSFAPGFSLSFSNAAWSAAVSSATPSPMARGVTSVFTLIQSERGSQFSSGSCWARRLSDFRTRTSVAAVKPASVSRVVFIAASFRGPPLRSVLREGSAGDLAGGRGFGRGRTGHTVKVHYEAQQKVAQPATDWAKYGFPIEFVLHFITSGHDRLRRCSMWSSRLSCRCPSSCHAHTRDAPPKAPTPIHVWRHRKEDRTPPTFESGGSRHSRG